MSDLTNKIEADLKQSMLTGDKRLTSVLKGAKNAIQYATVAAGSDLSDEEVIQVLQKESKKRTDAIELYKKAADTDRAENEAYEKEVIDNYLPEQLSEEEISKIVEEVIISMGVVEQKDMGRIIGEVRKKTGAQADGGVIARLVKEKISR